jgi:hypothetical protein
VTEVADTWIAITRTFTKVDNSWQWQFSLYLSHT